MPKTKEKSLEKALIYRWLIYILPASVFFFAFLHKLAPSVIRNELMESFGISSAGFANLSAMFFYAYMIMQIPAGILADTLGAKKTIISSCIVTSAGLILLGTSGSIHTAMLSRLIMGVGTSVVFISVLKFQTQWFREDEFGTMTGISASIGNFGGAVSQAPLAAVIALLSWRVTFIWMGIITIVLAVLIYLFVENRPEDKGYPRISEKAGNRKPASFRNIFHALLNIVKNIHSWPMFFITICLGGSGFTLNLWGVSYIMDVYNYTSIQAGKITLLLAVGTGVGAIMFGFISDRIKSRKIPYLICGLLVLFLWFTLLVIYKANPPVWFLAPWFFMIGFFNATATLAWSTGKEVNDPEYSGMATSFISFGTFLGAAVLPVIAGAVIDRYSMLENSVEIYRKAFSMNIYLSLAAFILILFVKETNCRNIHGEITGKRN